MARRPRPLTDHDRAHWVEYARHVRPLPGRPPLPDPPPSKALAVAPPEPPAPVRPRRPTAAASLSTGIQPPGLDNASWNRFREGKLKPARTLDLHGKTAQAAYHALERFLHAAHADRLRCVEIVTGRGKGEAGGVIRRELPLWLNLPTLRHFVLAAAHPGGTYARAENTGAIRLLLRKPK
jgi:DNA-nicking Smr family endonuclease